LIKKWVYRYARFSIIGTAVWVSFPKKLLPLYKHNAQQ